MGRPRSEAAHQAALDAAVAVLLESGVEGLTLEEVAGRSGVARSTLYRHFGSREALLVQAAGRCVIEHPTPDTGSLDKDLSLIFERYREAEEETRVPDLLPMLIDAGYRDPAVRALVNQVLEERRRPLRTVLRLAQLRGEIGADLDLEVALALLIGPITHRRMVDRADVTREFIEDVLRLALAALHATADGAAPTEAGWSQAATP